MNLLGKVLCNIGLHLYGKPSEDVYGSWGATWTEYTYRCLRMRCGHFRKVVGEVHNES